MAVKEVETERKEHRLPRARDYRVVDHEIDPIFVERWSPRAMSGESLRDDVLKTLFEAARWAPSSYNRQPWRFLYAGRNGRYWDDFFDLLVEFNQSWAQRASVLIAVVSKSTFGENDKPSATHAFDAGAAWENLALQGARLGLVVHAMEGFDHERAPGVLRLPDDHVVHAIVAVGHPGDPESLPADLREKEDPSSRRPVETFAWEGPFAERERDRG